MNDKEFEQAFEAIRQKFIAKLEHIPKRISEFRDQVDAGTADTNAYDEARMELHKLAGSARVFGMDELNELARNTEQLLNEQLNPKSVSPDRDTILHSLDAFILEARRCLKEQL